MTLTQEQMKSLAPFERHFDTAINGDWSPYPGKTNLEMMDSIWREVSGIRIRTDIACRVCVVDLLKDLGRLYFEVKAQRAKEKGQRTRQSNKQK